MYPHIYNYEARDPINPSNPYQCNILKHLTDLSRVRKRAKRMTTSSPEPIYNCPLMNMRSPLIRCSQTTNSWSKPSQYMTLCLRWISIPSACFRNITAQNNTHESESTDITREREVAKCPTSQKALKVSQGLMKHLPNVDSKWHEDKSKGYGKQSWFTLCYIYIYTWAEAGLAHSPRKRIWYELGCPRFTSRANRAFKGQITTIGFQFWHTKSGELN